MTFTKKIELKKEYDKWVEKASEEVGAQIDGSSFITVLTFLDDKGLLLDPNIKFMEELKKAAVDAMNLHPGDIILYDHDMTEPI